MRHLLMIAAALTGLAAAEVGDGPRSSSSRASLPPERERARDRVVPWRTRTDAVEGLAVVSLQVGTRMERRNLGVDDLIVGIDGQRPVPGAWRMKPDATTTLDVIRASGTRETIRVEPSEGSIVIRPWIGWCAGFRSQAGNAHRALDAIAAAEVFLADGSGDMALVELADAERAGAGGPWIQGLRAMAMHTLGRHEEAIADALGAAERVTPLARAELLLTAARSMVLDLRLRQYKDLLERHPGLGGWSWHTLVPVDEATCLRAEAALAYRMDAGRDEDLLVAGRTTTDRKGAFALDQLIASRRTNWMVSEAGSYHIIRLTTKASDAALSGSFWLCPQENTDTGWARTFFIDLKAPHPPGSKDYVFRLAWNGIRRRWQVTATAARDLPLPIPWPWDGASARRITVAARGPRIDLTVDGRVVGRFLRHGDIAGPVVFELWSEGMAAALSDASLTGHGGSAGSTPDAPASIPRPGSGGF